MKISVLFTLLLLLTGLPNWCFGKMDLEQSNQNLNFTDYLAGVRFASLVLTEEEQQQVDQQENTLLLHFSEYLKSIGFEQVAITTIEKEALQQQVNSRCDISEVVFKMEVLKDAVCYGNTIRFTTCQNDFFQFSSQDTLYNDPYLLDKLYTLWETGYKGYVNYQYNKRLQMPSITTTWTEDSIRHYLKSRNHDAIEGIYEKIIFNAPDKFKQRFAIIRNKNQNYDVIYLSGTLYPADWQAGELLGNIYITGSSSFFSAKWYTPSKVLDESVYVSLGTNNLLNVNFTYPSELICEYYKQFPKAQITRKLIATGTGIAISANGYIATSYHVVDGGSFMEVQLQRNGFQKKYYAHLIVKDEVNDLAILKIDDWDFEPLPTIPYRFKTRSAEVGEQVFTVGFPFSSTMGVNPKLTEGIISSQTGFKQDVSTYQSTVPVHPGNSGGPLFDSQGSLVGIIKAKHSQAESATYAVKTRNLLNLIELLPEHIRLPSSSALSSKTLNEQVSQLENYVFFIRVME